MVERGVVQQELSRLYRSKSSLYVHNPPARSTRTFLTTGRTHGLLSSSLYAPTPRLTFCGKASALKPAVSLKILRASLLISFKPPMLYRSPQRTCPAGQVGRMPMFLQRNIQHGADGEW